MSQYWINFLFSVKEAALNFPTWVFDSHLVPNCRFRRLEFSINSHALQNGNLFSLFHSATTSYTVTYSDYRGTHSFKGIVGVVTYVSKLYPGSISDKAIVQQSGFLNHLTAGGMVLADKGFVIQDRVRNGVSVNIPAFWNNGTESEARATKAIAKCRIDVERANTTRLQDFKFYIFISTLSCRYHISTLCITC